MVLRRKLITRRRSNQLVFEEISDEKQNHENSVMFLTKRIGFSILP
jgi:hypothetical protein